MKGDTMNYYLSFTQWLNGLSPFVENKKEGDKK